MKCQFCHSDVAGLARVSIYGEGIWVCDNCHKVIDQHRCHPYSKVMEKVAMLEAGYHVNRKLARIG